MSFDTDSRGRRARKMVAATMPEELCLSFPVPMWQGDELLDTFFTYSASLVLMRPYPPSEIRTVHANGEVDIDTEALILKITPFDTSKDMLPDDYAVQFERAYDIYEAACTELLTGGPGSACSMYTKAVKAASFASFMPYYAALAPNLFCEA